MSASLFFALPRVILWFNCACAFLLKALRLVDILPAGKDRKFTNPHAVPGFPPTALGLLDVARASQVEWIHASILWAAVSIYRDKPRVLLRFCATVISGKGLIYSAAARAWGSNCTILFSGPFVQKVSESRQKHRPNLIIVTLGSTTFSSYRKGNAS